MTSNLSQQDSCYSSDEEYFLDICRSGDLLELEQFLQGLPENSAFDWSWFNNSNDNFMHMIAANNQYAIFDLVYPFLTNRCAKKVIQQIINKQNSCRCTPLHYAVVTEGKQMVQRLLQIGADPEIENEHNRTPLQEAQKFGKYEIAELLALASKPDIEELKKEIQDFRLGGDSSDSDPEQIQDIEQKQEGQASDQQAGQKQKHP